VSPEPGAGSAVPAGAFTSWLTGMQAALVDGRGSDVPCGSCKACCTASQFVHIAPDERDTLAHIPAELLFPAPRAPRGHVLMGYDRRGHCPMLVEGGCSIYAHRPRTCRTYDCRVFPASGLTVDDDDAKAGIAARARRWAFTFGDGDDRTRHEAVRAAAAFLSAGAGGLPADAVPPGTTQRAVLAVEIADAFLARDAATGRLQVTEPGPDEVLVAIRRRRPVGR
jgi:uncharacterized protein